ncbi:hypothetical protein HMPREF1872_00808 [Amygdalobacter nucleatus]|uniref:Uncharacterized protein n=1 Tax=Amygdalobacter nucleatus TaxID=3029274 RepID=A0A133YCC8_9FIRM|nr:hypothetical protein HMPREF1872_00808 [Amygdalobacter nucleatus]
MMILSKLLTLKLKPAMTPTPLVSPMTTITGLVAEPEHFLRIRRVGAS